MSTQLDILDTLDEGRHPHPGMLQASLDQELEPVDETLLREHLAGCPFCRASLADLESAARFATAALSELDAGVPAGDRIALDKARWEVRRRRASGRGIGVRRSAAAAAMLVLVAGGAAAALPGSPLRSFFAGIGAAPEGAGSAAATMSSGAVAGTAGVAVGFRDGAVHIALESAPPGTPIELRVVEGDRVEVLAPEGARFGAGAGSVTIDLAGVAGVSETGILVRIPAGPGEVILRSGLRHLVRWQGGAFQFGEGVPADPRSDGVQLRVPE
jgi:anti-sigma factor RsiW